MSKICYNIDNGSNYDYVGMIEFDIPKLNPADINIMPNKFGGRM